MEKIETSGGSVRIKDNSKTAVVIRPGKDADVRLDIGKNCEVHSFIIQDAKANISQTSHIGEGSVLYSNALWLSEGDAKVHNNLEGKGAQAYDVHIFVEKEKSRLRLDTVLRHVEGHTKGNVLVKGIVKDQAAANLEGMIRIDKESAGSDSMLSEHVMLLNPGAHATANPELEIENNDVSSTHAASVSQMDEDKIFYLTSRGISRKDARKLIAEGFLESAAAEIKNEEIKELFLEEIRKAAQAV